MRINPDEFQEHFPAIRCNLSNPETSSGLERISTTIWARHSFSKQKQWKNSHSNYYFKSSALVQHQGLFTKTIPY